MQKNIPKEFLENIDILFIIHKAEGRIFLLGRNGFYNKIYHQLNENFANVKIFFFLLYKNILSDDKENENKLHFDENFQFQKESIDNLINKGDQKDLEKFKNENKIICLDDDDFQADLLRRKEMFENIIFKKFFGYIFLQ